MNAYIWQELDGTWSNSVDDYVGYSYDEVASYLYSQYGVDIYASTDIPTPDTTTASSSGWGDIISGLLDKTVQVVGDRYATDLQYKYQRNQLDADTQMKIYQLNLQQQLNEAQSRLQPSDPAMPVDQASAMPIIVAVGIAVLVGAVVAARRSK